MLHRQAAPLHTPKLPKIVIIIQDIRVQWMMMMVMRMVVRARSNWRPQIHQRMVVRVVVMVQVRRMVQVMTTCP